jgi:ArsR family transcriptional regulator
LDPVELLDILGNENRRRILQLLSFRPFYFNEIAKRLDIGPKAVIDHMEMLERAGLIECYHDTTRRKYFRIIRKTILEVSVSPHSYGVRAYRPEGMPSGAKVEQVDLKRLQEEISILEKKRKELRDQIDTIEARDMEIKRMAVGTVHAYAEDQLEAEILTALLSGRSSAESLAHRLEVPSIIVDDKLKRLESRGAVKQSEGVWCI